MKYLSAEQVLFIHSRIIDETSGSHGIRDISLLESAVARPTATFKGRDLYPSVFHKAAALTESIIKNHPFLDGNKRTAITSAIIFMQINGHILNVSQKEIVDFTLAITLKKTDLEKAAAWLKKHCALN